MYTETENVTWNVIDIYQPKSRPQYCDAKNQNVFRSADIQKIYSDNIG